MTQFQKLLATQEMKIDQKREQKHSILQECKMDDIQIPFKKGSFMDIDEVLFDSYILLILFDTLILYFNFS